MQQFVKHILAFAAIVLGLLALGEWYVESLPNPARDKHRWMTAHADSVETLILGDSHAFYGIRPDMLPGMAYSLAMPSQTLRYDNYLLHHYAMPRLHDVLLTVSYFTLWEDFELLTGHDQEIARYHIYMDCDLHRLPLYRFECLHRQAFVERLKSLYKPAQLSWNAQGWGDNYTLERRAEHWDNGEERATANTYNNAAVVDFNAGQLRQIIDYCRQQNVRLTLVTTPVSASFHTSQAANQVAHNRRVLDGILREHPEVRHFDYETDARFHADDFYDADHLSTIGAAKLTGILRQNFN